MIICLNACAQIQSEQALELVRKISQNLPKHYYQNPRLITSQIDAFMKCDDIQNA